ncbi:MAG: 4Fe-4S dicluster domain-containing protein [Candidatus Coatesbacteria bacterium]|nr:4Fe-4S dicluster domain-containing protein [Candidatus Coatesbacteria bacterium]
MPENTKKELNIKPEEILEIIKDISGQDVYVCYQCGKCTAGCPMSENMDIMPNQIIRLLQIGAFDELLKHNTIWLCASCLTCTSRCPKGVDLARIMEAVRLLLLRQNVAYLNASDIPEEDREELPIQALVGAMRKYSP